MNPARAGGLRRRHRPRHDNQGLCQVAVDDRPAAAVNGFAEEFPQSRTALAG
jgi:hypothetical protein